MIIPLLITFATSSGSPGLSAGASRPMGPAEIKARYMIDIDDGADWTEMDIDDLKAAIEGGASIEQAAEFLCRADSVDDVARKCEELVLKLKARS
jgi:hypothetical protein